MGPTVGISVDYESPLARMVAGGIWSGLSSAALGMGYSSITASWESMRAPESQHGSDSTLLRIFVIGQDHPDAVDAVAPVGKPGDTNLYGVVVAVPDRPSPLAGSLLYQGVERLTNSGVRAGLVEPAPLHAVVGECELYAERLLGRLREIRGGS